MCGRRVAWLWVSLSASTGEAPFFFLRSVYTMVLGPTAISVKTYVVCSGILYTKFLATTVIQGGKTFKAGGRPPEDAKLKSLMRGMPKQTYGLVQTDDEKVLAAREVEHRWRRVIANDLESLPFALFIFGSNLLAEANEKVAVGAMVVYTGVRLAHTWAYLNSKQPHRGYFWALGVTSIMVGVGNAVYAIVSK